MNGLLFRILTRRFERDEQAVVELVKTVEELVNVIEELTAANRVVSRVAVDIVVARARRVLRKHRR